MTPDGGLREIDSTSGIFDRAGGLGRNRAAERGPLAQMRDGKCFSFTDHSPTGASPDRGSRSLQRASGCDHRPTGASPDRGENAFAFSHHATIVRSSPRSLSAWDDDQNQTHPTIAHSSPRSLSAWDGDPQESQPDGGKPQSWLALVAARVWL